MTATIENQELQRPARWPAMPAIAVLMLCAGLTIAVTLAGAEPSVATLEAKANQAVAAHDDTTAILYYRHLLAIEPARPDHALKLGLAMDRSGRRGEAMEVLTAVAPVTGGGYGPAHLQLADWLVGQLVLRGSADHAGWDLARKHARAAQEDVASRAAASGLLEIINGADR